MDINLTIGTQIVTFAVFVWFCSKFIWPPLMRAIETRQKQVAEGLAAAEKGRLELSNAARRIEDELKGARDRAQEIVSQAEKRAQQMIEDAKGQARSEGERLVAAAKADIEQEVSRAKELLREQVAALAVAGAEKILRKEVDAKAHGELLAGLRRQL